MISKRIEGQIRSAFVDAASSRYRRKIDLTSSASSSTIAILPSIILNESKAALGVRNTALFAHTPGVRAPLSSTQRASFSVRRDPSTYSPAAFTERAIPTWSTNVADRCCMSIASAETLKDNVHYARHAISIDENRASFSRVRVGTAPHLDMVELGRHGRNRTNVWDYASVNSLRGNRREDLALHPTVKPTGLVADAILDVTRRAAISCSISS